MSPIGDMEILQTLQLAVTEMGLDVKLLPKGRSLPYDVLIMELDPDDRGRQRQLVVSLYPAADQLEASHFVQFYTQFPLELHDDRFVDLLRLLPMINNKTPLGYFGVTDDTHTLQFRYVWAISKEQLPSQGQINDVMEMCIFAHDLFADTFLDLEEGRPIFELIALFQRFDA